MVGVWVLFLMLQFVTKYITDKNKIWDCEALAHTHKNKRRESEALPRVLHVVIKGRIMSRSNM